MSFAVREDLLFPTRLQITSSNSVLGSPKLPRGEAKGLDLLSGTDRNHADNTRGQLRFQHLDTSKRCPRICKPTEPPLLHKMELHVGQASTPLLCRGLFPPRVHLS